MASLNMLADAAAQLADAQETRFPDKQLRVRRSRLCSEAFKKASAKKAIPAKVKKDKPFNYKVLRREAARGPTVMQAFNTVKEPPTPPYPGGDSCKAFYHGCFYRKTGMVKFFFDDEIVLGEELETFENLFGGPLPSFLEDTIPLTTTRLKSHRSVWKHKYLDPLGRMCAIILVGRV